MSEGLQPDPQNGTLPDKPSDPVEECINEDTTSVHIHFKCSCNADLEASVSGYCVAEWLQDIFLKVHNGEKCNPKGTINDQA